MIFNLYNTAEAAEALSLSKKTLERMRVEGTGPTFRKLGGAVRYREDDLIAWLDENTFSSTSAVKERRAA